LKITISSAQECAWRGRYLYLHMKDSNGSGRLLARATIDPSPNSCRWHKRANLSIALPIGWYTSCAGLRYPRLLELDIPLPYMHWHHPMGGVRLALYKLSSRFWHNMDGRYGWGSSYRKAKNAKAC
jgi:hypothetical protein